MSTANAPWHHPDRNLTLADCKRAYRRLPDYQWPEEDTVPDEPTAVYTNDDEDYEWRAYPDRMETWALTSNGWTHIGTYMKFRTA